MRSEATREAPTPVTIEERSLERRKRMVANRARTFQDAEAWDLDFWQQRTPEERLSALVAIRRDVQVVEAARGRRSPTTTDLDTVRDFEDLLALLERHKVKYLIIGGLAFIYHAKPRFTKDMDLWIGPDPENVDRANRALGDFGSPYLLEPDRSDEILQLGVAPNRIDLLRDTGVGFEDLWGNRIEGRYGRASASWVDLDGLIAIKKRIDHPRHQDDVRVLEQVRDRRKR